jgi:hypothetical protein
LARLRGALVDVDLAVLSRVPGRAFASVIINPIDAIGSVFAGLGQAFVDVVFAISAFESGFAITSVVFRVLLTLDTSTFVLARV